MTGVYGFGHIVVTKALVTLWVSELTGVDTTCRGFRKPVGPTFLFVSESAVMDTSYRGFGNVGVLRVHCQHIRRVSGISSGFGSYGCGVFRFAGVPSDKCVLSSFVKQMQCFHAGVNFKPGTYLHVCWTS